MDYKKVTQDGWIYYIKYSNYQTLLTHGDKDHLTIFRCSDFVINEGKIVKCRPLPEDVIEYYLCSGGLDIDMN